MSANINFLAQTQFKQGMNLMIDDLKLNCEKHTYNKNILDT